MPSGDYAIKPGAKVTTLSGFSSLPGSVSGMTGQGSEADPVQAKANISQDSDSPLNAPRLINFRGTEAQRLARDKEMQGSPVNESQKTFKIKDPVLAAQFGMKVGDVFDPLLNPRTGRYSYRGVDVTNGIEHYEKPPAPDRVLIQTGDGYMRRTDAAAQLGEGKNVPLATTNSTRTMEEGGTDAPASHR
jgi:hypothetical protein